jgi:hypothetical protein
MGTLRNIGSWLCLYLVVAIFFLTASVFAFFRIINADNLKSTLGEEGTYAKVVPTVLETAAGDEGMLTEQQIPLDEPWVREATDKAFPASDLEQKTAQVVDGTFNWLEGKTAEPEFIIDFTTNKQALGAEVANHVEARAAGLPRCGLNNIPISVDAFRATCLPYGVSPQQLAGQTAALINNDQGFLGNPVISPENLTNGSAGLADSRDNPFDGLKGVRSFYKNKTLWLWLLPITLLLLSVGVVWLALDRRKALGRLTKSYLTAGIVLLVFALLSIWVFENIVRAIPKDNATSDLVTPVMLSIAQQNRMIYLVFAGVALLSALGLFAMRRYKSK